jgi:hypothetical protein
VSHVPLPVNAGAFYHWSYIGSYYRSRSLDMAERMALIGKPSQAVKLTAKPAKAARKPAKTVQPDGHYKLLLGSPIPVEKAKIGMKAVKSGALCTIRSITPAKGVTGLYCLSYTGHPYRQDFGDTMQKGDPIYREITSQTLEI